MASEEEAGPKRWRCSVFLCGGARPGSEQNPSGGVVSDKTTPPEEFVQLDAEVPWRIRRQKMVSKADQLLLKASPVPDWKLPVPLPR
ncbi:hypothetical protein GCM10012289_77410 [Nonomuraea cavernae]|uniref:Uncharacterized protein n=1 Tax=Nonomuraea cavernae TaxID=2045107 RepID=A0A917ZII7_9ACTN|nr:hypothetical protein GCM10012289_77410 [Nonomuraea cavernae]